MRYLLHGLAFIAIALAFMYVDHYTALNAIICTGLVFASVLMFAHSSDFVERWTHRKPVRSNRYDATYFLVSICSFVAINKLIPEPDLFVSAITFGLCLTASSTVAQSVFGARVPDLT